MSTAFLLPPSSHACLPTHDNVKLRRLRQACGQTRNGIAIIGCGATCRRSEHTQTGMLRTASKHNNYSCLVRFDSSTTTKGRLPLLTLLVWSGRAPSVGSTKSKAREKPHVGLCSLFCCLLGCPLVLLLGCFLCLVCGCKTLGLRLRSALTWLGGRVDAWWKFAKVFGFCFLALLGLWGGWGRVRVLKNPGSNLKTKTGSVPGALPGTVRRKKTVNSGNTNPCGLLSKDVCMMREQG